MDFLLVRWYCRLRWGTLSASMNSCAPGVQHGIPNKVVWNEVNSPKNQCGIFEDLFQLY